MTERMTEEEAVRRVLDLLARMREDVAQGRSPFFPEYRDDMHWTPGNGDERTHP